MNTNIKLKLVDKETGIEVKVGDMVTDFRGETGIINSIQEPYDFENNSNRGAKVYVKKDENSSFSPGYYPSVFGLQFVKDE